MNSQTGHKNQSSAYQYFPGKKEEEEEEETLMCNFTSVLLNLHVIRREGLTKSTHMRAQTHRENKKVICQVHLLDFMIPYLL